jgi:two-component system, NtrC family, response regulator AtoC
MASPQHQRLIGASRADDLPPDELIFGQSQGMQAIRQKIDKVAATSVPVLIEGDSGTGKGVLARYIHHHSAVSDGPLVKVNCAAIPGTLLESELFGYEKGAFTGAYAAKQGRVESANGGTLFLDGIDEIDMGLQAKLLQLLQDAQFTRIGGREDINVEIRVLCATNRSLDREVSVGRFRQDLYYRINVVNIVLPALRSRGEDIADLAAYFLDRHQKRHRSAPREISPALLRLLERHAWPGNIRELENLIERYVILGSEEAVSAELLQWDRTHIVPDFPTRGPIHLKKITRQAVQELEGRIILSVLEANRWNRKRAASELRISYRALLYKIRQAGLPPKRSMRKQATNPVVPVEDIQPQ